MKCCLETVSYTHLESVQSPALSSVTTTVPAEPVKPDIHLRASQCLGIYSPEWGSVLGIRCV